MTRIALIPAYQPGEALIELVNSLSNSGFDIVVVDDGSGSKFNTVFNKVSEVAYLIQYDNNMGKGSALRTGLCYIQKNYKEPFVVVTADADGQHKMKDIIRVTDEAQNNRDSLVLGSRRINKNVPLKSKFGNIVTRGVFGLVTGRRVYDTQTGLRSFSDKLLTDMRQISGDRYEYEMNVLMEFSRKSIPIKEIEIETVYLDDNSSSHFDAVRDSARIYKEILKFSASSLSSFLVDYVFYCLFNLVADITVSNVMARIISASYNYTINRKIVFKSKESIVNSLFKYVLLAVCILICNTYILKLLVSIGINKYTSKIFAEIIMFIFSFLIQRFFIFRGNASKR